MGKKIFLLSIIILSIFTSCHKELKIKPIYTKFQQQLADLGQFYSDRTGSIKKLMFFTEKTGEICCSFFEQIPDLEELYIKNNSFRRLDESIIKLKKLKVLHLELSDILEDASIIERLPQLEILYLRMPGFKTLEEIPIIWSRLENLKSLTVSYPKGDSTYPIFSSYPTEVPSSIFQLKKLEQLHIDGWNLKQFPAQIIDLKNLHTLSVISRLSFKIEDKQEYFRTLLKKMDKLKNFKIFPYLSDGHSRDYDFYDAIVDKGVCCTPFFGQFLY